MTVTSLILTLSLLASTSCFRKEWSEEETKYYSSLSTPANFWWNGMFGEVQDADSRALLKAFKPSIYVSPKGLAPIDFYSDYLPQCDLIDEAGNVLTSQVSRTTLQFQERSSHVSLKYRGSVQTCSEKSCGRIGSVGYGNRYYETILLDEGLEIGFHVLKYNYVFPRRGLPARLSLFQEFLASVLGDSTNWAEPDIHGAVHIFVNSWDGRPQIVMLAQPNQYRTYLVGEDIAWDQEKGLQICFAERSNVPYPCPQGSDPLVYKSEVNPADSFSTIYGRGDWWINGEDLVYGPTGEAVPVSYELAYLPEWDPLFVSWMPLGSNQARTFLGRSKGLKGNGSPGMNFKFNSKLSRYIDIAQFFYFDSTDGVGLRLLFEKKKSLLSEDYDFTSVYRWNSSRLRRKMIEKFYPNYTPRYPSSNHTSD